MHIFTNQTTDARKVRIQHEVLFLLRTKASFFLKKASLFIPIKKKIKTYDTLGTIVKLYQVLFVAGVTLKGVVVHMYFAFIIS